MCGTVYTCVMCVRARARARVGRMVRLTWSNYAPGRKTKKHMHSTLSRRAESVPGNAPQTSDCGRVSASLSSAINEKEPRDYCVRYIREIQSQRSAHARAHAQCTRARDALFMLKLYKYDRAGWQCAACAGAQFTSNYLRTKTKFST